MGIPANTTPQRKFGGGLNTVSADVDVKSNELLRGKNARLHDETIETAPGFRKYSTTVLSGAVKFIWGDEVNSLFRILIAAGANIYSAAAGVYTSLLSGLTPTATIDMERYLKRVFIGSSIDACKKYDGTSISAHGIVAPTTNIALAEINPGAGVFPNAQVRKFYVTFWDNTHKVESNPNGTAPSITIAAGPSNIRVSTFPTTTDTNVTHYRLYMTENGGATWYRIQELSYAIYSVASYDVVSATDGEVELEYDNDQPSDYDIVEYFKNRLYVKYRATPAFINFSKSFRPEQFPPPFRFGIGDAEDEEVVALIRFDNFLVIGTNQSIWVLDGDPVNNRSEPRQVTRFVGMINNRSYAILDNEFMFLGTDRRIYSMTSTDFQRSDVRPKYSSYKIEPTLKDITPAALMSSVATFQHINDRYEALFSCPIGSNTTNNSVLVYDPSKEAWLQDDKRISAFGLVRDSTNAIKLYFGDENGYVNYEDETYTGYGALINGTVTAATTTVITATGEADIISTATAGGAATLTDASLSMTVDQYEDEQIYISAGTGAGQYRTIFSNTATQFTVTVAWATPPDNTSQYIVGGFLQNALNGLDVTLTSGTGDGESRVISSHTPTTITVGTAFSVAPDTTTLFSVGGIDFDVRTGWDAHTEIAEHTKRGHFIHLSVIQQGNYSMDYSYARDMIYGAEVSYTLSLFNGGYLWGTAIWGTALWGVVNSFTTNLGFEDGKEFYGRMQHRFRNRNAGQPVQINYVAVTAQDKGIMI